MSFNPTPDLQVSLPPSIFFFFVLLSVKSPFPAELSRCREGVLCCRLQKGRNTATASSWAAEVGRQARLKSKNRSVHPQLVAKRDIASCRVWIHVPDRTGARSRQPICELLSLGIVCPTLHILRFWPSPWEQLLCCCITTLDPDLNDSL